MGQIFSKRTSRRFVAGRIVTDSEIKMNFLLSKVNQSINQSINHWLNFFRLSLDSISAIRNGFQGSTCRPLRVFQLFRSSLGLYAASYIHLMKYWDLMYCQDGLSLVGYCH